jgi:hypothetical protein
LSPDAAVRLAGEPGAQLGEDRLDDRFLQQPQGVEGPVDLPALAYEKMTPTALGGPGGTKPHVAGKCRCIEGGRWILMGSSPGSRTTVWGSRHYPPVSRLDAATRVCANRRRMLISELLAALSSFADGKPSFEQLSRSDPDRARRGASWYVSVYYYQLNQRVGRNIRLQIAAGGWHHPPPPAATPPPGVPRAAAPTGDADDEGGGGGDDDACDAEGPQSWHPQTNTAQPRFR